MRINRLDGVVADRPLDVQFTDVDDNRPPVDRPEQNAPGTFLERVMRQLNSQRQVRLPDVPKYSYG